MENRRVSFSICSGGSAPVLMGFAVHSFSFKHPHSRLAASVFMLDYICWSIGSAVARMALAHQRLIGESLLWLVITDSWEDTHTHLLHSCMCVRRHTLVGRSFRWNISSKTRDMLPTWATLQASELQTRRLFWHNIRSTLQLALANKHPLGREQSIWSACKATRHCFIFTFHIYRKLYSCVSICISSCLFA